MPYYLHYVLLYTLQKYLSSIESIYTCSSKISSFSLCYNTSIAHLMNTRIMQQANRQAAHMHNV